MKNKLMSGITVVSLFLSLQVTDFVYSQQSSPGTTLPNQTTQKANPLLTAEKQAEEDAKAGWKDLFIKNTLEGWEKTNFGGEGDIEFSNGNLVMESGHPLTGIHFKKEFPKDSYEIRWEANRLEGSDFLVGLTFPVADEFCSLIAGGWGGGVIGLSSIHGADASENETTAYEAFKNNQWYRFLLRVEPKSIHAWMNDKEIVDLEREGKAFSLRAEVRPSRPLGYAVFQSRVAIRKFQYRSIQGEPNKKP